MLDAETWLSAQEAYQYGLCDVVEESNEMAASISDDYLQRYKNVPKNIINNKRTVSAEEMAERKKISEQARLNAELIKDILGGI